MKLSSLEAVFRALNEADVRYLVVGGVAVNVHGYQRATQDLDLVVELERENVLAAVRALAGLAYRPVLPVDAERLADPAIRREWHERRNVEVFSMTSDIHRETTVDLFVNEPFPFAPALEAAFVTELAPGLRVPVVALDTLIRMKAEVDRPRDQDDVQHLRWLREEREGGVGR